ncbi:hypothetical protein AVEN_29202-1 [Araneus ventricosus]|uniref:Uncharacterized protein n=1 Tax=Araneus ventricosus TaxID=182803 RepID=A0A4Y2AK50_ARAVE|nr:hypothetical protein AVEN_29202-1 [Araneus ventricosus]
MTRVEPFGKVAESFAGQQEARFSVRFLVRFPQAFITGLFQAFQKVIKSPPSADKLELPCPPSEDSYRSNPPFFTPSSKPYSYRRVQPLFLTSSLELSGMSIN